MDKGKRRRLNAVYSLLPDDLLLPILSHLDVKTLIEKTQVCRSWRVHCTESIDAKQTSATRKAFSTSQELRQAVRQYCGYNQATRSCSSQLFTPKDAEEIAQTYGYPINKWDVSKLNDFDGIFGNVATFNEDISSWNVSNAYTMKQMFADATSFNQDLSSWDVSNVWNMYEVFLGASSFNQNLSRWNVSNVRYMEMMFMNAASFDQDISNWNVSNVWSMVQMFCGAYSFNQNLSRWDVSNALMTRMLRDATSFDQDIESWELWDASEVL
jgi:surface protein